ncbi:MAG: glycosyltransferase family 9 protein, partial [Flavobacteriaceae bacterium]|nr:glycosyltransferase family 9 protein [Flavobacteriaceae bacterium]
MIGDVLVSSIICNNLKKAYPDAEIHYMVYESTLPVLTGNPNIDKIVLFTARERRNKWAFLKFLLKIRREQYDILIDSYSKLESWLTTFFSGARRRISYKKPGRSFLYTDVVSTFNEPMSNLGLIIERRMSLLDPLNLDIDPDPVPKLYVTKEEKLFANQLLRDHGLDSSRKKIMISILGSSPVKTYPLAYMAKLIDFIVKQTNSVIFFNYIPSQLNDAKTIFEHCEK